ncbi:hypothetical protein KCP76_07490 [Salmonella enterica subsp. enterica serovar Weltevreden]|nr:hypothetical protein KCP76_07490 [Salmonella enterica subsp. enterica serovar Weltevreden]
MAVVTCCARYFVYCRCPACGRFTAATLLLVLSAALFMDALSGLSMAPNLHCRRLPQRAKYRHELKMPSIPLKVLPPLFSFRRYVAKSRRTLCTHLPWVAASVVILVVIKC